MIIPSKKAMSINQKTDKVKGSIMINRGKANI
jgi:hypothetical protein